MAQKIRKLLTYNRTHIAKPDLDRLYLSRSKGDRGNYTTYFDLEDHNNRINMVPKNNRRIDAKISEKTKRSQKTLLI